MKRNRLMLLAAAAMLLAFATSAMAADVFQGLCSSYDEAGKTLVLKNSEPEKNLVPKDMAEVSFDLSQSKVGLVPAPGDKMRVAYSKQGDKFMALKVMNVSKQDLRKK